MTVHRHQDTAVELLHDAARGSLAGGTSEAGLG